MNFSTPGSAFASLDKPVLKRGPNTSKVKKNALYFNKTQHANFRDNLPYLLSVDLFCTLTRFCMLVQNRSKKIGIPHLIFNSLSVV